MRGLRRIVSKWAVGFAVCLTALGLGSCRPLSVSVALGHVDAPLDESVVLSDPGSTAARVAMIDLRGVLIDGRRSGMFGPGPNPVDEFVSRLNRAREDGRVRAVVVRINSPGGSVTASDMIYDEIARFRAETGKPVVASIGEIGASGGYYIALACDEIVVQPTAITGSIGVIVPTLNVSAGLNRIGIVSRSITSGPNKAMLNPLEPASEAHFEVVQHMVDQMYERFVGLIRARRSVPEGLLAEATDGRVMVGTEAVRIALADSEGGFREAFARAKTLAGIDRARLVKYHAEGEMVRTAYATSPIFEPAASAVPTVFSIESAVLGDLRVGRPYYLWLPSSGE